MKIISISFVLISTILTSCRWPMEPFVSMRLANEAPHSITALVKFNGIDSPGYPDVTLPQTSQGGRQVFPGKEYEIMNYGATSEDLFDRQLADTLSVFILHTDTLQAHSWEELQIGYKILKRYDLSRMDLERLRYKLSLSGIKMYP